MGDALASCCSAEPNVSQEYVTAYGMDPYSTTLLLAAETWEEFEKNLCAPSDVDEAPAENHAKLPVKPPHQPGLLR